MMKALIFSQLRCLSSSITSLFNILVSASKLSDRLTVALVLGVFTDHITSPLYNSP
jgi:hypothetical protein